MLCFYIILYIINFLLLDGYQRLAYTLWGLHVWHKQSRRHVCVVVGL